MYPITIVFLVVFTLSACHTAQYRTGKTDLQRVADKALGEPNSIEVNETKTFALCQQKPGADHARRQYRFVVIRLKDGAIVHDGTFSMGYVKWRDDQSIEVVSASPSSQEGSTKRIIHVNSLFE